MKERRKLRKKRRPEGVINPEMDVEKYRRLDSLWVEDDS